MAIDDLLDEHEQSERVRGWLRNNGGGLIAGVIMGLGVIGGWQWWQQHQAGQRTEAGRQYDAVVATVQQNNLKKAMAGSFACTARSVAMAPSRSPASTCARATCIAASAA